MDDEPASQLAEAEGLVTHLTSLEASVAQVAIAWLLSRHVVTSVLVGASKRAQLEDNLGADGLTLTDAELAELDAATPLAPVYPSWFQQKLADTPTAEALRRS